MDDLCPETGRQHGLATMAVSRRMAETARPFECRHNGDLDALKQQGRQSEGVWVENSTQLTA